MLWLAPGTSWGKWARLPAGRPEGRVSRISGKVHRSNDQRPHSSSPVPTSSVRPRHYIGDLDTGDLMRGCVAVAELTTHILDYLVDGRPITQRLPIIHIVQDEAAYPRRCEVGGNGLQTPPSRRNKGAGGGVHPRVNQARADNDVDDLPPSGGALGLEMQLALPRKLQSSHDALQLRNGVARRHYNRDGQ